MSNYDDLPTELQNEVLLVQSPTDIINHCKVNQFTRQVCSKINFWSNYIQNLNKDTTMKLLIEVAKQSQEHLIPLFDAIYKRYTNNIPLDVLNALIFISAMRKDESAVKKFGKIIDPDDEDLTSLNSSSIIIATNKVIDVLNAGNFDDMNHVDAIIENFYKKVIGHIGAYETDILIWDIILDRVKIGVLDKLPAWQNTFRQEDDEDYTFGYIEFMWTLAAVLSRKCNIVNLLNLVEKFYNAQSNITFPIDSLYREVAGSLPVGLYSYVESQLALRNIPLVTLFDHLDKLTNNDQLIYVMGYVSLRVISRAFTAPKLIDLNPEDFVNILYQSTLSLMKKKTIMENVLESFGHFRSSRFIKWRELVEKKWEAMLSGLRGHKRST